MGRLRYCQGLVLGYQETRDWNSGVLTAGMGKGPVTSGLLSSLLHWYPQDTPDSITPLHLECTYPGLSTQCLHSIRMTRVLPLTSWEALDGHPLPEHPYWSYGDADASISRFKVIRCIKGLLGTQQILSKQLLYLDQSESSWTSPPPGSLLWFPLP